MQPTAYPEINDILHSVLTQLQNILRDRLIGLYLYGSLVTGDFDFDSSDIDLLAVTASDINEAEFQALDKLHQETVARYPAWKDRLEIAYLSLQALKTFKTQRSQIAIISPGEPFHFKEAGNDWLINWYVVREKGRALAGPPPEAVIEPISRDEYTGWLKKQVADWREWVNVDTSRPFQAYAILTMCRALRAYETGEQVSKIQAALWAADRLPQWSATIHNALRWRQAWRESVADPTETLEETRRFVHFVIDHILN